MLVAKESPEDESTAELVPGFPPSDACHRPFLIFDAEPGMRIRFERCCAPRAELAAEATKTWRKEFREPIEPVAWPASMRPGSFQVSVEPSVRAIPEAVGEGSIPTTSG